MQRSRGSRGPPCGSPVMPRGPCGKHDDAREHPGREVEEGCARRNERPEHTCDRGCAELAHALHDPEHAEGGAAQLGWRQDRKSTRLNSSHANISYAVFCLKKKKKKSK